MSKKNIQYLILDVDTAECYTGFSTREQAINHIQEQIGDNYILVTKENYDKIMENEESTVKRIIVAPMQFVQRKANITIYPSWQKSSLYGEVAEYADDFMNSDILEDNYITRVR